MSPVKGEYREHLHMEAASEFSHRANGKSGDDLVVLR